MPGSCLFVITQVAPYRDGPAGVHGVLRQAEVALSELGEMAGLVPRRVRDVTHVDPSDFAAGGVLALFTIGETPWSPPQRSAITEGVRSGRLGVVGVHSATDSCAGWDDYGVLLGARFDGHPWTRDFVVEVTDSTHPATEHLGGTWDWHDEIYTFKDLRPDARVLLRVAEGEGEPAGLPLAWCFEEGTGRVFYTSLGHFPGAWEIPPYLRHLAGGLSWVLAG